MRIYKYHERVEAASLRRGAPNVKGGFIAVILPILIQVFQACLNKTNPPIDPQPASSKATPKAWETAVKSKAFAIAKVKDGQDVTKEDVEYKKAVSNAAAHAVMRQQRKKNDKITKEEAVAICLAHLDQARLGDLEENALKLDETKSV